MTKAGMLTSKEICLSEKPKTPEIFDALIDQLLKDYKTPEDLLGPGG